LDGVGWRALQLMRGVVRLLRALSMTTVPKTAGEWLEAIHREFAIESDRGAAIVAAAMLDDALKSLLKKRLCPPASKDRSILERYDAPLGSFAARIDAAQQLGLVSKHFARDLHLIRDIRNDFAHAPQSCRFDTSPTVDRVTALEKASDINSRYPDTRAAVGPPGPRWDFLGVAAWMLYQLHCELESAEPLRQHGPEFGYIDWDGLPPEVQEFLRRSEAT
jgi:hypothetical protein